MSGGRRPLGPSLPRLRRGTRWARSAAPRAARPGRPRAPGATGGRERRRCRAAGDRTRGGPRARLRRPVLAADRAPDPRVRRLRRAPPSRPADRDDPRAHPARPGALRRPGVGLLRRGSEAAQRAARARNPGARHLLRDAGDGARARRPGRSRRDGGVRAHRADAHRRRRPPARRAAPRAAVLDEPPRLGLRPTRGLHGARRQPGISGCGARAPRARPLRDPVSPRGRPYPIRPADPGALPARDRGLRGRLVAGVGDRRAGRADPGRGRRGRRDLRALGRGRLRDRGGARAPRGRRPARLRARRSRADAQERGPSGGRGDAGARGQPDPRRRRGALPRSARRGRRPGAQAEDHRRGVHPRLRGGGREARRGLLSWSRARCTRT